MSDVNSDSGRHVSFPDDMDDSGIGDKYTSTAASRGDVDKPGHNVQTDDKFPSRHLRRISNVFLVGGIVAIICQTVLMANGANRADIGGGFWAGIFFVFGGALGLYVGRTASNIGLKILVPLSIWNLIMSAALVGVSAAALHETADNLRCILERYRHILNNNSPSTFPEICSEYISGSDFVFFAMLAVIGAVGVVASPVLIFIAAKYGCSFKGEHPALVSIRHVVLPERPERAPADSRHSSRHP